MDVEPGHGFNGGTIYYPTDSSLGTWGAVAAVPGYTACWEDKGAWMGHWIASFGFVVIGIDTNSPEDWDDARGEQLLAALDYLSQESEVAGAAGRHPARGRCDLAGPVGRAGPDDLAEDLRRQRHPLRPVPLP